MPAHARRTRVADLGATLDLASELRSCAVPAKALEHLQTALPRGRFALLVTDGDGVQRHAGSGIGDTTLSCLAEHAPSWAAAAPLLLHSSMQPWMADGLDGASVVCTAPLVARDDPLGVLTMLARRRRDITRADRELLSVYARHTGVALDNARRFTQQQALAQRDPLTGLLNHREFHERIAGELERCRTTGGTATLALVTFDLDGFKRINDSAGHATGDRVLRAVAGALAGACRVSDLAFRTGGDEFALLLADAGRDDAVNVAERARASIRTLHPSLDVSYGVASWPEAGPSKELLLARADAALYAMKHGELGAKVRPPVTAPIRDHERVHHRLAVANRLAAKLAPMLDPEEVCRVTVDELHVAFHYYLAVVHRLDPDGMLRVVAGAGPLTAQHADYLAWEQPLDRGVNGRVARTGEPALVPDTHHDPDYLRRDPRTDPGSELTVPIRVAGRVWGVLNLEEVATRAFDETDLLLADTIAAQVGAAMHRAALRQELEGAFAATLGMLSDVLEAKDSYTAQHADEVKDLADRVCERLAVATDERRRVCFAALLHDIGKIGVPSELLGKPGPLDPDERVVMQRHAEIGAELLERVPFFADVAPLVRWSHERWDGRGYPDGLVGGAAPLGARIVAACDAFHAMTSDRPYRSALPLEVAISELVEGAGTQFDPAVVDALVDVADGGAGSSATADTHAVSR